MSIRGKSRENVLERVAKREPFQAGAMSGKWYEECHISETGRLPQEWKERLTEENATTRLFVVFSYTTPIGWSNDGKWFVVPETYHGSIQQHQHLLMHAIRLAGGEIRRRKT